MLRQAWYEIDLGAIRHNYRELRRYLAPETKVFACLKRNGYGCGAGSVARALAAEGVDGFGVVSLGDAQTIRNAGVALPILLYPGPLPDDIGLIDALDLMVTVSSEEELDQWMAVAKNLRIFIKVDLGFLRAGALPASVRVLLNTAIERDGVCVEGIYAHLSELPGEAHIQFERFCRVLRDVGNDCHRPRVAMLSSTEGVLDYPEMDFDAVDPGALLVGLAGGQAPIRHVALKPALAAIKSRIVSVKQIDTSIDPMPALPGYRANMIIGVLAFGWGDGLPRVMTQPLEALVRGRRVPLLGPVHLEHVRLDLTAVPDATFADEVVLLGKQGSQTMEISQIAVSWETDVLGIYGGLRDHIPRIYIE